MRGVIFFLLVPACLAGEFVNLGFEEVDLTAPPFSGINRCAQGFGQVSSMLPGWTLYSGGGLVDTVFVNQTSIADAFVMVGYRQCALVGFVDGLFAVQLFRDQTNIPPWTLEQIGTIPPDSHFLAYRSGHSEMQVRINDEIIPPLNPPVNGGPSPFGVSADTTDLVYEVSKFSGQEVKLDFVGPFGLPNPFAPSYIDADARMDKIRFLTQARLKVTQSGTNLILSWPASATGYGLQNRDTLSPTATWQFVAATPVLVGSELTVTTNFTGKASFYQLSITP